MLFSKDSRLCDAIFRDPSLIPVIDRFGISLGVGDKTIEEICKAHDMPADFFLAILNTYLNADYMPDDVEDIFKTSILVEYLSYTDDYYTEVQIPNIERHFKFLIDKSPSDNNLNIIFSFFKELRIQLEESIKSDYSKLIPMISKKLEDTIYVASNADNEGNLLVRLPHGLGEAFTSRNEIEDKINDLVSIFVVHLKGDYDKNLCMAVINALFVLRKDICQNNRIRNRILLPACVRLFGYDN